ncbi:zinc finger protein ZAT11-like [Phragmites australis]|uniref:zinc finger protein ZAT11-like n=1 Tax=Phragmites australis TaxID=29695 RepID=UPI002D7796C5|nr:zinc finger protein ZAT11-like [Phragmites australis]
MNVSTARTPAANANDFLLFLSLSPASKVIAKAGKQRVRLPDGAFQCRTCGRRFATFQALGGHRTSHKRPRVRADGLDLLLGARPGKGAARDVHRCNTCGMVFPTGQALGGHMRRHRAALDVAASETTTSGLSEKGDSEDDAAHLPSTLIQFI